MGEIIFLKLGGSLITDKTKPYTPRLDSLARLAREISSAMKSMPDVRLIIGHGSGSFGHYAVKESLAPHPYPGATQPGGQALVRYWQGFAEVWYRASQLNRHVVDALHDAELPVLSFPPSATARTSDGAIKQWDIGVLRAALQSGLIPVIYGDIAFDEVKGGTILSTEMLMHWLARELRPTTILLAGLEAAVWADFPRREARLEKITAASFETLSGGIGGSHGTDVTGGMHSKVQEMLDLVKEIPSVRVQIFSGEEAGNVQKALEGELMGTLISSD